MSLDLLSGYCCLCSRVRNAANQLAERFQPWRGDSSLTASLPSATGRQAQLCQAIGAQPQRRTNDRLGGDGCRPESQQRSKYGLGGDQAEFREAASASLSEADADSDPSPSSALVGADARDCLRAGCRAWSAEALVGPRASACALKVKPSPATPREHRKC